MRKVISCGLALALVGVLGYFSAGTGSQPGPDRNPEQAAQAAPAARVEGGSQVPRFVRGVGAAVAIVLPVGCGGGGKGPTTPPPPPRTFTVGLSREATFDGFAGCASCTSQHEILTAAQGILEATLVTEGRALNLVLRALSPSGRTIAGSETGTLRIPAEPGRWVLSVSPMGEGGEPVHYRLRVVFP